MSGRLRAFVITAASLATLLCACHSGADREPAAKAPDAPRFVPSSLTESQVGIVESAFTVPRTLRMTDYGAQVGDRYLTYTVGPSLPNGHDTVEWFGTGRSDRQYAVVDRATGVVTTVEPMDPRAFAISVAVAEAEDGTEWAVRLEAAQRPPERCPLTPDACSDWTLYANALPDGHMTRIAQSAQPGSGLFAPAPQVVGDTVVWLDASRRSTRTGPKALVTVWHPGDAEPRQFPTAVVPGKLSLDEDSAWVSPDFYDTSPQASTRTLMRFDLDSGHATPVQMPNGAFQTIVRDGHAAWIDVSGRSDIPMFADRPGDPASWRAPPQDDIYTLDWAPDGRLLVNTNRGYRLFGEGSLVVVEPEPFWGVDVDGDTMSFVVRKDSGEQTLVLIDMDST